MRRRKVPPVCRAYSQLNRAVRAPPICSMPVGEGAKRRTGLRFCVMVRPCSKRHSVRTGPLLLCRRWGPSGWAWPGLGTVLPGVPQLALNERHRWPLWLPVALGTGAALYFAMPVEPQLAAGWAMMTLFLATATAAFRSSNVWTRAMLALLAALSLGFGAAKLRETRVATPVLNR